MVLQIKMSQEEKIFDGDYNLFNNPMIISAKKQTTKIEATKTGDIH